MNEQNWVEIEAINMTQFCSPWLNKCPESQVRASKIKWLIMGNVLLSLAQVCLTNFSLGAWTPYLMTNLMFGWQCDRNCVNGRWASSTDRLVLGVRLENTPLSSSLRGEHKALIKCYNSTIPASIFTPNWRSGPLQAQQIRVQVFF